MVLPVIRKAECATISGMGRVVAVYRRITAMGKLHRRWKVVHGLGNQSGWWSKAKAIVCWVVWFFVGTVGRTIQSVIGTLLLTWPFVHDRIESLLGMFNKLLPGIGPAIRLLPF
jgi:hypothetical protein